MSHTGKYIADRFKEIFTEGKWVIGTNYTNEIDRLHWETAVKSVHGLNTIAKIVFHIHY